MDNFKIVKRGYSQIEVDSYIDRLKFDYESRLSEQKDRIFYLKDQLDKIANSSDNELMSSLVSAIERAKVIENSSKNIYELETKKLSLLYSKMENLLIDEGVNNERIKREEFLLLIQDCRKSLQNNIQTQREIMKESTSGDPIKRLLSKMIGFNKLPNSLEENRPQVKVMPEKDRPETVIKIDLSECGVENSPTHLEVEEIVNIEKTKKQEGKLKPDLAEFDKFLSKGKISNGTNFETIMFSQKGKEKTEGKSELPGKKESSNKYLSPNESGFDLKEAVNPKEDLNEIMKAFSFYNDFKKKN